MTKTVLTLFGTFSLLTALAHAQPIRENPCGGNEMAYQQNSQAYFASLGVTNIVLDFGGNTDLLNGKGWLYALRGQSIEADGTLIGVIDVGQCVPATRRYKRVMANASPLN